MLSAELKQWLPPEALVYLIGDREFHGQDMLTLIQPQGWIPVVRSKGNLWVENAARKPPPPGILSARSLRHPLS